MPTFVSLRRPHAPQRSAFLGVIGLLSLLMSCREPRESWPPDPERELDAAVAPDARPPAPGAPDPITEPGCDPGAHRCGGACVDSRDPGHCGFACAACPTIMGGTATCDGTRCSVICPAGQKPCLDACVPAGQACNGQCPVGQNACGGICVDTLSVIACGSACVTCPTSPFGTTSCDGDKCDLTCVPGYHRCGDGCVDDKQIGSCGASCTPCPAPVGGTATCDGTSCGSACPTDRKLCLGECIALLAPCAGNCPAGKHACGNDCVANSDVNSCGASCSPCKAPTNATATCDGSACQSKCRGGFHDCGGACKDDKSVASCGPSCSPCPAPAGTRSTCNGGVCDFECTSGHKCNGACQQCCNASDCPAQANHAAACNGGICQYTDTCVPDQMCAADTACQTWRSGCAGGSRQCNPVDKPNGTRCGSGASAGNCSGGTCVSACAGVTCNGHGSCAAGLCTCTGGWTGATCQVPPDLCMGVDCGAHGSCTGGACVCRDEHAGGRCQSCNGAFRLCGADCIPPTQPCGTQCGPGRVKCGNACAVVTAENCSNQEDDDCNGLVDCADTACKGKDACLVWTAWLNRDMPNGNGEEETLAGFGSAVCPNPVAVECRDSVSKTPSSATGQTLAINCTLEGLRCLNTDNAGPKCLGGAAGCCLDYEVRFRCPK
jgi:hypothetical protein